LCLCCLLSWALSSRSSKWAGVGFYGSDHCPLTMELGKATHEAGRAVESVQSKQFNALDA